jgi:hypothetical protein
MVVTVLPAVLGRIHELWIAEGLQYPTSCVVMPWTPKVGFLEVFLRRPVCDMRMEACRR